MDEKDSEIEDENNNINTNNNINNNNLENNSINIDDEERRNTIDTISSFFEEEKFEEIKLGSKIRCPKPNCFENCIISIDPNSLEVNYECRDHKNKTKMDIIDFVKKSGITKEGKEKCSNCKKIYKDIKQNKKKLYKCYCGNNICEDCKKEHIEQNKNNKEHNMVDFEVKDYICNCNEGKKKYIEYCITCKKNLCIICSEKHKDHIKKNLLKLDQLTNEKKKQLKFRIDIQKKLINKFNKIIDDWFIRIKKYIDLYKKKLELYNKINLTIFNIYNRKKYYYESIKNIEYMRMDFDQNFMDLINAENDYLLQNSIIFKILN